MDEIQMCTLQKLRVGGEGHVARKPCEPVIIYREERERCVSWGRGCLGISQRNWDLNGVQNFSKGDGGKGRCEER